MQPHQPYIEQSSSQQPQQQQSQQQEQQQQQQQQQSSQHHRADKPRMANGKQPAHRSYDKPYSSHVGRSKQRALPDVLMLKSEKVLCFCGLPATRTESPDIGGVYDCHFMNTTFLSDSTSNTCAGGIQLQKGLQASRRVRVAETAKRLLGECSQYNNGVGGGSSSFTIPELKSRDSFPNLEANWQSHPDRESPPLPELHARSMRNALRKHWEKTIDPPVCSFHVHEDAWDEIREQECAWYDYTCSKNRPSSSNEPSLIRPSEIYPRPAYENTELMLCPWFNATFCIAFRAFSRGPRRVMQLPTCYCGDPVVEDREFPGSCNGRRYRYVCSHAKEGLPNRCAWILWAEHIPFEQPQHLRHPVGPVNTNPEDNQILNERRTSLHDNNGGIAGIHVRPPDPIVTGSTSNYHGSRDQCVQAPISSLSMSSTVQHQASEQSPISDEDGPVWISNSNQVAPSRRKKANTTNSTSNSNHQVETSNDVVSQQARASTSSSQSYSRRGASSSTQNIGATTSGSANNEVDSSSSLTNGTARRKNNKKKKQPRNQYGEAAYTERVHNHSNSTSNNNNNNNNSSNSSETNTTRETRQSRTLVSTAVQTTRSRTTSEERTASSNAHVPISDYNYRSNTSTYPPHSTSPLAATYTNNASTSATSTPATSVPASTSVSRTHGYGYKSNTHHRGNNANVNGYGMAPTSSPLSPPPPPPSSSSAVAVATTSNDVAISSSTHSSMTVMDTRNTATSPPNRTRGFSQSSNNPNYGRVNVILPPPIEPTISEVVDTRTHYTTTTLNNDESDSSYRNRNSHRNPTTTTTTTNNSNSNSNTACNHCNCHLESRPNNRSSVIHESREESTNYTGQSTTHSSYYPYNNNVSTEEETRRNSTRWSNQSTEPPYASGSTNDRANNATATATTTTTTTSSFTRTAPRGRAPLPPPLPDPIVTSRESVAVNMGSNMGVSTSTSTSTATVATSTMPPPIQSSNPEDIPLPIGIDAQRDAFRRLQEELLQMKHTNRRLQNENTYLHQVNEQLESTHTELLQMTRNQLVHLDSNTILNSNTATTATTTTNITTSMNEGEDIANNTNAANVTTLSSTGVSSLEDNASQISIPTEWRCRICYEQPISQVIIPCGHAVACENCALSFSDHCCVCRSPMTQVIRLYFG